MDHAGRVLRRSDLLCSCGAVASHLATALIKAGWEGDTLVIETANINPAQLTTRYGPYRGASENVKVIERLTRTGQDVLEFESRPPRLAQGASQAIACASF